MSGAGPQFPKFPYDIFRIHTLMIYSDIVEYNSVGDTKAALYDAFCLYQKLRMEISSQRTINELSKFSKLKNKKNSEKHIPQHKTRALMVKKVPFNSVDVTRVVLRFRKTSDNHF